MKRTITVVALFALAFAGCTAHHEVKQASLPAAPQSHCFVPGEASGDMQPCVVIE